MPMTVFETVSWLMAQSEMVWIELAVRPRELTIS